MRLWHVTAILVCSTVCIAPSMAEGRPSRVSGIFSSVFEHPETGDLLGTEVEIHADVPKPYAFVTLCEGWCNVFYRAPLKIDGNRVDFSFAEQYVDTSGAPAERIQYHVTGRVMGRTLKIRLQSGSHSEFERLTRRAKRFGLAVARPETAK